MIYLWSYKTFYYPLINHSTKCQIGSENYNKIILTTTPHYVNPSIYFEHLYVTRKVYETWSFMTFAEMNMKNYMQRF